MISSCFFNTLGFSCIVDSITYRVQLKQQAGEYYIALMYAKSEPDTKVKQVVLSLKEFRRIILRAIKDKHNAD